MPVEVEVHAVPHSKAQVSNKVALRQLECSGVCMFYTACNTWVFYYIKWALSKQLCP